MSDKPAPRPVTPQQQGARPESVSSQRLLRLTIAGTISNKFSGSHPETMAVSRITHHIYSSILGWVEPVMIRSVSEQYEVVKLSDKDEKYLKGCFRIAISRELDPAWDSKKIAPLVLEIYTAITKAFHLVKRPVFEPETEAEAGFNYESMANNLLLAIMNAEKGLRPNERGIYSPLNVEDAESLHSYLLLIQHYDQNKRLMASYGVVPYIVPDVDETEAGE